MSASPTGRTPSLANSWIERLAPYREPDLVRSIWQLSSTAALLAAVVALMYLSLDTWYGFTLLLAVPAAFLLVRLFIVQHDCGHGAFFRSAHVADLVGSLLGVFTLTPYHYWKRAHGIHHATSGNLDHRGVGDIDTLTLDEYLARDAWGRFKYRVYRHPLVLFGIGAVLHFLVRHRLPTLAPRAWRRERWGIVWTDLGLAAFVVGMSLLVGLDSFLRIYLPVVVLSCSVGVWLFYVQHQFEPTYWEHDPSWTYAAAALDGSSYYQLPKVLQWLTGNIGLHHIHHLSARIPNYRLQQVLDAFPELQRAPRITLWQSFQCVSLKLWDEQHRRLIPFPAKPTR